MAERLFKIFLVLSIFIILPIQIGTAEQTGTQEKKDLWRELNHTSDSILRNVKEGNYDDAKELLNRFSDDFLSIRAADENLTMRELQVITSVYDEVNEAVVSVSLPHKDRVEKASKLRLLVDVYDAPHEMLWERTRSSLITPISNMKSAVEAGNNTKFQNDLNAFINSYETVRPAWSISLEDENYEMIEAQIKYLQHLRGNFQNDKEILEHLDRMEAQLNKIYDGTKEDTSDPSLIWVMLTIGGAIVLSLTYTGWKKYKGEKEREKQRRRDRRRLR
ncbi:sporulation protein YpjB [Evansella cellulosilytica]|uniref:Sporulation protein YpjB n=1 Tax=Evansella cellulosilytica (strain ATCC 21833 / DSM 2522 / FERM P-1141 / JCM 9156 / N-4) TaxID=649639 RepID=E6TZI1_EVAC2|nr:sporulation protein YpjB [Evansella cellulosilytica]ADU30155.1 Sporulation protein YpjB [Evansella cellulosilytica DSM 2522]